MSNEESPMGKPDETPPQSAAPAYLSGAGQTPEPSAPVSTPPAAAPATPQHTEKPQAGTGAPDWMQQDMTNPDQTDFKDEIHRLYIKQGESKDVIFLTEWGVAPAQGGPIIVFEHNPQFGEGAQRFKHYYSCLQPLGIPCPMCQRAETAQDGRRYKAMMMSAIDCTGFQSKQGLINNFKTIICFKQNVMERFERKMQELQSMGHSLRGAHFKIFRSRDNQSPKTGDDFSFQGMVDLAQYPDNAVHDWANLIAPDPVKVEEAMKELANAQQTNFQGGGNQGGGQQGGYQQPPQGQGGYQGPPGQPAGGQQVSY